MGKIDDLLWNRVCPCCGQTDNERDWSRVVQYCPDCNCRVQVMVCECGATIGEACGCNADAEDEPENAPVPESEPVQSFEPANAPDSE